MNEDRQLQSAVNRNKCPVCGMALIHWFDEYGSCSECTDCSYQTGMGCECEQDDDSAVQP